MQLRDAARALAAHGRAREPHQPRRPALGLRRAGPGALRGANDARRGARVRPRAGRQGPRRIRRPAGGPSARSHRPLGLLGRSSGSASGGAGRRAPVLLPRTAGACAFGKREAPPARSGAGPARGPARPRNYWPAGRSPCGGSSYSWRRRARARAQLADLFVGPARNVMVYFADLLGMREVYNRPGTVGPQNWSLRVPPDFVDLHARRAREGSALDLPAALAAAMRARGPAFVAGHRPLLTRLEGSAARAPGES